MKSSREVCIGIERANSMSFVQIGTTPYLAIEIHQKCYFGSCELEFLKDDVKENIGNLRSLGEILRAHFGL
jgi:hypothetical protein